MVIALGERSDGMKKLKAALVTHHKIKISAQLMTLEHEYVGDLSDYIIGGQVSFDAEATESTRAASLELLDPKHKLKLDSDSPVDGSMYATRMVRITYSVYSVGRKNEWHIPIFTGPLNKVSRNGPVLTVEALGKDVLARSSVRKGRDFKEGFKKIQILRILMREYAGERRLDFPSNADVEAKTTRKMSIDDETDVWEMATSLARSMGMHLFYDGRGVCRLRRIPNRAVYVFQQKGALLTHPQTGYDLSELKNAVKVKGGKPKKADKKIYFFLAAKGRNSLSPRKLGRWDTPRYLIEEIEDDSIKSKGEARKIARSRLKHLLLMAVEVTFDTLPIPFLEELDICRVSSDTASGQFKITKMTIPLKASDVSNVGYLRRVVPRKLGRKNNKGGGGKGRPGGVGNGGGGGGRGGKGGKGRKTRDRIKTIRKG